MDRFINFIIYVILLLSIWVLLGIGFDLSFLLISSDMTLDTCNKFNNLVLNLAYSYVAGFVMYTLTVTIPQYRRRKANWPLIKNYIDKLYSSTRMNFFLFYAENDSIEISEKDKALFSDFRNYLINTIGSDTLNSLIDKDESIKYGKLKLISESNSNFINRILPYESFLTTEQVNIINEIKQKEISFYIDLYEGKLNNKLYDNFVYSELSKHMSRISQLKSQTPSP